MHAILSGIAGVAPSSTTQNLVELLSVMNSRLSDECKAWIPEVLFSVRPHLSYASVVLTFYDLARFHSIEGESRGEGEVRPKCCWVCG